MSQNHKPIKNARLLSLVQIPLLTCTLASAPVLPLSAQAQQPLSSEVRQYNIPAGPLDQVLTQFIEASGLFLAGQADLATGVKSPGVQGSFSPEQALEQLLAGTGLSYWFTGADTVTLAEATPQDSDGSIQLGPIQVTGEAGTDEVENFRANTSSSATNVNARLIETPATVNVLTEDFIDTIGAGRIEDMLQYVPGASAESANATANQFNIRGFSIETFGGGDDLTGGVRIDDFRTQARRYHFDSSLYERIDILKGSAGLLYGTAAPGGVVRYITKKPEFESRYRFAVTLGSFETARGTVDLTGPVGDGSNMAYRLIATSLNSNQSFHGDNNDRSFDDRIILNPQLTWLTPGGGELRVSYEYSQHDNVLDPGIKRLSDGSFTFNTEPFLGPDGFIDRENHIGVIDFTQFIGETWQLQVGGSIGRTDIDALFDHAQGDPDANDLAARQTRPFTEDSEQEELRMELSGQFNTGALLQHSLTFGWSYLSSELINNQTQLFQTGVIDARNPIFGPAPTATQARSFSNELEEKALYLQDFISVGEKLKFFGGIRYTEADINNSFAIPSSSFFSNNDGSEEALDYTIGAIYNQNHWLNPFVSYSTALTPQTGTQSGSGDPVPFREGEQIEVGFKSDWFDGGLATTISVFEIKQTSIAEEDPANPGFSILAGDQRTRGLEIEAAGNITDQFRIIGGYSYLDAEFTKSTTGNEGNAPHSVPEQKFSVFGEYAFTGELQGWSAGIGFIHVGDREGDNANTFELPSYERVDFTLAWEKEPFDFRASIENVLDEDYIIGSSGFGNLAQGAPRFFTLTVGYEF